MSRRGKRLVFVIIAVLVLGGAAPAAFFALRRRQLCPPDAFVVVFERLPEPRDILRPRDSATAFASMFIFDQLVRVNAAGELVPALAESFEARQEAFIPFRPDAVLPNGKESTGENIKEYLSRINRKFSPIGAIRTIEILPGDKPVLKLTIVPPLPAIRELLRGALGEKVIASDGGETSASDSYSLHIRLREGIVWHDGVAFTALDVKLTAELVRAGRIFEHLRHSFELISDIKVLDEYHLIIEYKGAAGQALWDWQIPILPHHILNGRDVTKWPRPGESPIGTGPFRWTRSKDTEQVTLELEPGHFDPPPSGVNKIIFQAVPKCADMVGKVNSKVADAVDARAIDPSLWLRHEKQLRRRKPTARLSAEPPADERAHLRNICLVFNLRSALFHDAGLRRTIVNAIDRATINALLDVSGKRDETIPRMTPAQRFKAALLELKTLGWSDSDGDGILERGGSPLKFDCFVTANHVPGEIAARMVCEDLNRLLVRVSACPLDEGALADRLQSGDFDLALVDMSFSHAGNLWSQWHSSGVSKGTNWAGLASPQVDSVLEKLHAAYSPAERKELVEEVRAKLIAEHAIVFLGTYGDMFWREDLAGPKLGMIDFIRSRERR